jgi:g-D-glutamyl-meso-diaminopimelate peptidase
MLNPDGVDYQINGVKEDNILYERVMKMNAGSEDFSKWKANSRGVDLTRNYNCGFTEYKKRELEEGISTGAPGGFSGNMPESEPEVASLCNYLRFNDNIKGVITLDTQGNEIYCPIATNDERTDRIGITLSRMIGYRQTKENGNGLADWCASVLKRQSFTLKCGVGEAPLPLSDNFKIYADIRELLFTFPTMIS